MGSNEKDSVLWLEAMTGTPQAFGHIFLRYHKRVLAAAYRHVEDFHQAEEAMSIVFLELWRLRKKVRIVDESLLPWILSVTNYTCLNLSRAKRRQHQFLAKLPPPTEAQDAASIAHRNIESDRQRALIQQALEKLNDRERVIVLMCLVDEIPIAAAATALDIPFDTAKTRLYRARAKLRIELDLLAPAKTLDISHE